MERLRVTLFQGAWFIVSVWTGSTIAAYYFFAQINEVWHKYPWYKLIYMLPWAGITSGIEGSGITAISAIVGLLIVGFLSARYNKRVRDRAKMALDFASKHPGQARVLELIFEQPRLLTDEQLQALGVQIAQGIGLILTGLTKKQREQVQRAFPGTDIDFRRK